VKASKYNVEELSCPMRVRMVTRHLDHENTVIFVWVATNGGRVFSLDSSICRSLIFRGMQPWMWLVKHLAIDYHWYLQLLAGVV